jgi:DNA mismatch endonuclease (patch repair protein)
MHPDSPRRVSTTFGGLTRPVLMSRIRSRGNATTEIKFLTLLRASGITGWRRHLPLIGKPDFVFRSARIVVFLDGCFWHGHNCGRNLQPKTNARAWTKKIQRNRRRDAKVSAQLKLAGWKVIRLWECTLKKQPQRCIAKLLKAMRTIRTNPLQLKILPSRNLRVTGTHHEFL